MSVFISEPAAQVPMLAPNAGKRLRLSNIEWTASAQIQVSIGEKIIIDDPASTGSVRGTIIGGIDEALIINIGVITATVMATVEEI